MCTSAQGECGEDGSLFEARDAVPLRQLLGGFEDGDSGGVGAVAGTPLPTLAGFRQ